jgi:hypothetical protein
LGGGSNTIQNIGLLETVAEVSVAFAGFAGIVSVFGRSRIDPEVRMWRIRVMILTSLVTLLFALLPAALLESGLLRESAWRISTLLLSAGIAAQLYLTLHWMPASFGGLLATRIGVFLSCSSIIFSAMEFGVSLKLIPLAASAAYFWGLLYLLFLCAQHFFRLILAVDPDE